MKPARTADDRPVGSQSTIRAPIEVSLSTKNSRFSNIFSKISTVPSACVATASAMLVRSAGNAGHGPSSIFGIASPTSSLARAAAARAARSGRRRRGATSGRAARTPCGSSSGPRARCPVMRISPPVTAASAMKLADLDVVGRDRRGGRRPAARCPCTVRTFEPMPSIRAPIETSSRARSCTCGSEAALRIVVVPGVSAAAISVFSVAITLASSMKKSQAAQAVAAPTSGSLRSTSICAPSARSASRCGSSRRRPMKSPPGGGMCASPARASSGPASRNDARMRPASVGVDLGARDGVGAQRRPRGRRAT